MLLVDLKGAPPEQRRARLDVRPVSEASRLESSQNELPTTFENGPAPWLVACSLTEP